MLDIHKLAGITPEVIRGDPACAGNEAHKYDEPGLMLPKPETVYQWKRTDVLQKF